METERAKTNDNICLIAGMEKNNRFSSSFMVETTVENTDGVDTLIFITIMMKYQQKKTFGNSIGDYLTFEFNMMLIVK